MIFSFRKCIGFLAKARKADSNSAGHIWFLANRSCTHWISFVKLMLNLFMILQLVTAFSVDLKVKEELIGLLNAKEFTHRKGAFAELLKAWRLLIFKFR